jgi:hypothetical protein
MNWFKRKQQQNKDASKTEESPIALSHVFTDSLGRKWYEFENMMTMPAKRAIAAEVATRMQEMNLTKEQLLRLMTSMKKHANDGNIVELFTTLGEIEYRLHFIGEEETLIELAACYFVIEGEDPADFSDKYRKVKVDFIKENKEAFNFFVQRAFTHTIAFSEVSDIDIQEYLVMNAHNAKRILERLRRLS